MYICHSKEFVLSENNRVRIHFHPLFFLLFCLSLRREHEQGRIEALGLFFVPAGWFQCEL